jgi:hypothetical protein
MDTTTAILRAVKELAPVFGGHPVAVWHAAKTGAQQAAEVLPEGLAPVKDLIRNHPVLATCAVLAIGGFLSARGLVSQTTSAE